MPIGRLGEASLPPLRERGTRCTGGVAMSFTRQQVLSRLRQLMYAHVPIIGAGAGTGISAKFEEAGGVDLIVIYNSGRFRMAGHGSPAGPLPYGAAHAL